jgi:hypothetical protein
VAVNWREHYSTGGSSEGGLEEEVLEAAALGSRVAVATRRHRRSSGTSNGGMVR